MSSVFRRKREVVIKDPSFSVILNFLSLPVEILYDIFLYLSYDEIVSLVKTNKYLNFICKDKYLWRLKMSNDFDQVKIDKTKSVKAQYQLCLADKLAKKYNETYNPLLDNKRLRAKILNLTSIARKLFPLTPLYKYIEIIIEEYEIDGILENLKTLSYNREKYIPLFSFIEFTRNFGFLKDGVLFNYKSCIGFTLGYGVCPKILGYIIAHKNRLYLNWEEVNGNEFSSWPIELYKDFKYLETIKRVYPTLNIGTCSNFYKLTKTQKETRLVGEYL